MMNTNRLKMGGMAAALTAIVIAAVILVNMLAGMLTDRFFLKLDLTASKLFELSEESAEILRDLPGRATIYLLMNELDAADLPRYIASNIGIEGLDLVALLEKYSSLSGGKVTLRYLDPTLNPTIREDFNVGNVSRADLLVQGEETSRVKHIPFTDLFEVSDAGLQGYRAEQTLTGALLHVLAEYVPRAVFAEGHGMLPTEFVSSGASLAMLYDLFEKGGFSTSAVNLADADLPPDTHLVVVACPSTDFTQEEIAKLDDFIKSGGNVLYLASYERNANLGGWLTEWGVKMEDHFILDDIERTSNPTVIIPLINAHEMFNSVGNHSYPWTQLPRALTIAFAERGSVTVQGVLGSSPYSYGRLIDSDNPSIERTEEDASGPFIIGTVSTYRTYDKNTAVPTDSYLVVLPVSLCFDYVLSTYAYLNNDMTGGIVRYLTPADISSGLVIPSKALANPILTLTGIPSLAVSVFLVGILPPGLFVMGLIFWRKRRKK